MSGLPPLSLSTGPAVSEAQSGLGGSGTGPFVVGRQSPGMVETLAPWAALALVAWLILRAR